MNNKYSCIKRPLLAFLVLLSTTLPAFAKEDCNVKKVDHAMILEKGGIGKPVLSADEYKAALSLKNVQVINGMSKVYYDPDLTRLTVVQVSGTVTGFSCNE
ncbi:hypothetical protein [Pseudomonas sp. Z4-20]|uniref:hypothetical protein n=1 Tax=Pseudomonas sp. Z4-20 TaxID=2817414 RepID=UPI003DA9A54E